MKFNIYVFYETLSRKFKSYYNRTKIIGTLHEDHYTLFYNVIEKDGLNFARLYFLNYIRYLNYLHNI